MVEPEKTFDALRRLIATQPLAVLSTDGDGEPYASLVAIASTGDLRYLFFATTRATRKYANVTRNPRVALLVDNRSNRPSDFQDAVAATVLGQAEEISGPDREEGAAVYLAKHPRLEGFLSAPTCALFRVRVERYYLVSRFQSVAEYQP